MLLATNNSHDASISVYKCQDKKVAEYWDNGNDRGDSIRPIIDYTVYRIYKP